MSERFSRMAEGRREEAEGGIGRRGGGGSHEAERRKRRDHSEGEEKRGPPRSFLGPEGCKGRRPNVTFAQHFGRYIWYCCMVAFSFETFGGEEGMRLNCTKNEQNRL